MPPPNMHFTFSSSRFHLKERQGHAGVQQQLCAPVAGAQTGGHGIRTQGLRGLSENVKHPQLAGSKENLGDMKRRDWERSLYACGHGGILHGRRQVGATQGPLGGGTPGPSEYSISQPWKGTDSPTCCNVAGP